MMINIVDPNETVQYVLSHLYLHCLHRYLPWSTGLTGLSKQVWYRHLVFGFFCPNINIFDQPSNTAVPFYDPT